MATVKPSRAASARRRGTSGDPPQLAGEPDLADRRPGRCAAASSCRRRRPPCAMARSAGRLGDAGAADGRDEDVAVVAAGCRHRCCSTATHHRRTGVVDTGRRAAGRSAADWVHQRLHLREHRPLALERHRDAGAGTASWCRATNSDDGSVTAEIPSPDKSKQPTSSTGPNRFLIARTIRSRRSARPRTAAPRRPGAPSTRGPAIEPSLVTWPTIIVAMPRVLAILTIAAATSLTWVTPPGTPSTPWR